MSGNRENRDAQRGLAGGRVVFNITGGNLIMRLALRDLAPLRPNVVMVYRPENRRDLLFRALLYPGLMPEQRAARHGALEGTAAGEAWVGEVLHYRSPGADPQSARAALAGGGSRSHRARRRRGEGGGLSSAARKGAVRLSLQRMISSGGPDATRRPPSSPGSGPMSRM